MIPSPLLPIGKKEHGMLRIALKCRTARTAHTIFATTLPWGVLSPDVSDAGCRCGCEFTPGPHGQCRLFP